MKIMAEQKWSGFLLWCGPWVHCRIYEIIFFYKIKIKRIDLTIFKLIDGECMQQTERTFINL